MTTPINPLPTPPSPADSPADFNTKAFALLGALPAFVTEANAQASGLDAAVLAAETEADAAALKAGEALTSANNAAISKTGADSARDAAVIAKNAAEVALDSFDDRYLGAKAVAPTTDNDGGALLVGALYFRTTAPIGMKVWTGTAWDDAYANLSSKFDKTGGDVDGNINFTGTARRISGDFSNPNLNARLAIQSSIANAQTNVQIMPNGTSVNAGIQILNGSDATNCESLNLAAENGGFILAASYRGAGTYKPLGVVAGGKECMRFGVDGSALGMSGPIGYGVGAGGYVVQATSKSTTVTLNKPSGRIVMHNAALAAGATVAFQLTNSLLTTFDGLVINCIGGVSSLVSYRFSYGVTVDGAALIYVTNQTGGSLSEGIALNFQVLKGALS